MRTDPHISHCAPATHTYTYKRARARTCYNGLLLACPGSVEVPLRCRSLCTPQVPAFRGGPQRPPTPHISHADPKSCPGGQRHGPLKAPCRPNLAPQRPPVSVQRGYTPPVPSPVQELGRVLFLPPLTQTQVPLFSYHYHPSGLFFYAACRGPNMQGEQEVRT